MSVYNNPILHNGSLNSVINVSDVNAYYNNKTLSTSLADSRYLQLKGGYMSGPLYILGNEIDTNSLSTNTLSFLSNTTNQTSSQLGGVISTNYNPYLFTNTWHTVGYTITLPQGVFIISTTLTYTNNSNTPLIMSQWGLGFSNVNDGSTRNSNLVEFSNMPFTISTQNGTEVKTRTWIFKNNNAGIFYLFYYTNPSHTNFTLNEFTQAVRIA